MAGYPQGEGVRRLAGYTQLAKNSDRGIFHYAFLCVAYLNETARCVLEMMLIDAVSRQGSWQSVSDITHDVRNQYSRT